MEAGSGNGSLLAYLGCHPAKFHPRILLKTQFWGNKVPPNVL